MNSHVRIVSLLLFVSGMCALIFQTAWLREFRLIFGASTPAAAAVLAIFMGGLGLGNAWLGKRADGSLAPLRMYGQLELAISAAAILSPFLVQAIRSVYIALGGQETLGVLGATIVRLVLSTLVIGVPTFLMGGTLPAAARAVTAADDHSRRGVGWLYGLNTLGAVLGALLGTFVLLERLGTRQTLWAAAAINLGNAYVAWKLAERWAIGSREPGVGSREEKQKGKKQKATVVPASEFAAPVGQSSALSYVAISPPWLYAAAGIVGFAFLLMELVWYRMLGPILGGTTFTFGLILAVALAGIGVGGALYPLLFRTRAPTLRDLGLTCGWEALAIALPLALGDRLAILTLVLQDLRYFGFEGQVLAWVVIAGIVIFPAAVVSGIQFPLLIALLGQGNRDVGRHVGRAFAFNTLGAMLGSLAGGFGLLPLASAVGAWHCVVILLALLALSLLLADYGQQRQPRKLLLPLAALAAAGLCLLARGPTAVWRHGGIGAGRSRSPAAATYNDVRNWMHDKRRNIAWQKDGAEVSLALSTRNGVAFLVNGKSDGNALSDAGTQIMFPVVGAMLHPDPRESLVIGLGTGESAGWLASLPGMTQVDVVEIEPAIAAVAAQCALVNHDVLRRPNVRVIFNDAREQLLTTRRQYDLIASEPSNPYRAGVASLYTREFYLAVRQRLRPRGLFMQWLQGYEIDVPTVRTVLTTLRTAFPHVEIWETKPGDMVLVCSGEPFDYDLPRLQARLAMPAYREAARVGWRTTRVEGVLAHFIANWKFAAAVAAQPEAQLRVNIDNQNLLEYSFARTVGQGAGFSIGMLREEARSKELHRPLTIASGIDWEQVEDEVVAYNAGIGDVPQPPQLHTGQRAKRAEALHHYFHGNSPAVLTAWSAQPKQPVGLVEVAALALAHASAGDDQAKPLIERLQPELPNDVLLLRAMLAYRQKQTGEAVGLLEQLFLALRSDPVILARMSESMFPLAIEIAAKDKTQAQRLFDALSQPLAVRLMDDKRQLARCILGQHIGPAATAAALEEIEPHVPWDQEFLQMRSKAYRDAKHPRADAAASDLATFGYWTPEVRLLPETP